MLYTQKYRSLSRSLKNIHEKFSFLDNFHDEKDQLTLKSSQTKNTESETDSCMMFGQGTPKSKGFEIQYYSQNQNDVNDRLMQIDSIILNKNITYGTCEQYKTILQCALKQINLNRINKVYLRLIIVDNQYQKDKKLQRYLNQAIEQYRKIKEQQLLNEQVNSADDINQQQI